MTSGDSGEGRHGLFLSGEYLGVKHEAGRARTSGDGNWPDRYKVGIRVGPDVFDVEYGSVTAAELALAAENEPLPQKGDTATLTVRGRATKGGYLFWMGQEESGVLGDYE